MSRIKTAISGITTRPDHPDGECRTLVNLRPSNGAWKPVPPRKSIRSFTGNYSIFFVHRIGVHEKWIGVNGDKVYDITGPETHLFTIPQLFRYNGTPYKTQTINSVQQIGYTLSFVTTDRVYYALLKDGDYIYLGEIPDLPVVNFSTPPMTTASRNYHVQYPGGVTRGSLLDATKGLVGLLIDANRNKYHDAFMIRYAFRLYDGSVIKHSPPLLIIPREHYNKWGTAVLPTHIDADVDKIATDSSSSVTIKQFILQASYDFTALSAWKDIIRSVDFFVSPYVGLAGPENVVNQFWTFRSDGVSNIYKSFRRADGYYVAPSLPGSAQSTSPSENRSGASSGAPRRSSATPSSNNQQDPLGSNIEFITPPSPSQEKDRVIGASGNFYLYYSEDSFDAKNINFPNGEVTTTMDSIIYQEEMPSDDLSHHKYGAIGSSVYNNRLRLFGITTHPFDGFQIKHFEFGSDFNGMKLEEGNTYTSEIYIAVKIRTPDGDMTVQQTIDGANLFLNPFISYPDPRAFRIEIFRNSTPNNTPARYTIIFSADLSPHPYLNIAYALNDDLTPWIYNGTRIYGANPQLYERVMWTENNKIKVSEVDNPFSFPANNTYQIGSGEILAESSIVMNVSDRNYGLHPVFVFTTDGVFTMSGQTPDLVHENIKAPTYAEPPISSLISPTPYGVIFITKKGLMMINQHGTEYISPFLKEIESDIKINMEEFISPLLAYPSTNFRDHLRQAVEMIYNPYNDELIICGPDGISYVYDFQTKQFYSSTALAGRQVKNTYPDVYLISGKKIRDISKSENKSAGIALVTRPLRFGTYDIKKLHRVAMRALMHNTTDAQVALYHSMDDVNFTPAKGYSFGEGKNYKDLDFGLLARQSYRQYIFVLTGTFDEETEIRLLEFEIEKNYNDEKLR